MEVDRRGMDRAGRGRFVRSGVGDVARAQPGTHAPGADGRVRGDAGGEHVAPRHGHPGHPTRHRVRRVGGHRCRRDVCGGRGVARPAHQPGTGGGDGGTGGRDRRGEDDGHAALRGREE